MSHHLVHAAFSPIVYDRFLPRFGENLLEKSDFILRSPMAGGSLTSLSLAGQYPYLGNLRYLEQAYVG